MDGVGDGFFSPTARKTTTNSDNDDIKEIHSSVETHRRNYHDALTEVRRIPHMSQFPNSATHIIDPCGSLCDEGDYSNVTPAGESRVGN